MTDSIYSVFPIYGLALFLLFVLVVEAILKRHQKAWSLPALSIYVTTLIWYFVEFIYTPEEFQQFPNVVIEDAYFQIILFLFSFRLCLSVITQKFLKKTRIPFSSIVIKPERLLFYLSVAWAILLVFGIFRMNGDLLGALIPIKSRAGGQMWGRAAVDAGSTGFIVSAAAYLYSLICSFLGILFFLQRKVFVKIINIIIIAIFLPYFVFAGARNQLLAVAFPAYFTYILISKQKIWIKVIISLFIFIFLNYILTLIITYRNTGFDVIINSLGSSISQENPHKHAGLNMLEELCYINDFYQKDKLQLSYGGRYFAELVNFIPRSIWTDKPLIGIDYAILRGYGSNTTDSGVFATISTGFIGQGIINFGPWLGAIAPGMLMASWATFLSRLWVQRKSTLRLCLFLAALGITFNLGRDITLLVLFPIVFGYALVRIIETMNIKHKMPLIGLNPPTNF